MVYPRHLVTLVTTTFGWNGIARGKDKQNRTAETNADSTAEVPIAEHITWWRSNLNVDRLGRVTVWNSHGSGKSTKWPVTCHGGPLAQLLASFGRMPICRDLSTLRVMSECDISLMSSFWLSLATKWCKDVNWVCLLQIVPMPLHFSSYFFDLYSQKTAVASYQDVKH